MYKLDSFALKIIAVFILLFNSTLLPAQHYIATTKGTEVKFSFKNKNNAAENIKCTINDIKADFNFDPLNLSTSSLNLILKTSGLRTGKHESDVLLKGEHFFYSSKYPTIQIISTSITKDRPSSIVYSLKGTINTKGITQPINIQFTASPLNNGYVLRGSFSLKRSLFFIGDEGVYDDTLFCFLEIKTVKK